MLEKGWGRAARVSSHILVCQSGRRNRIIAAVAFVWQPPLFLNRLSSVYPITGDAVGAICKLTRNKSSSATAAAHGAAAAAAHGAAAAAATSSDSSSSSSSQDEAKHGHGHAHTHADAASAASSLPDELTINVEYNQLEGLLGKTEPMYKEGAENYSVYPGNTNVFILALPEYAAVLAKTQVGNRAKTEQHHPFPCPFFFSSLHLFFFFDTAATNSPLLCFFTRSAHPIVVFCLAVVHYNVLSAVAARA